MNLYDFDGTIYDGDTCKDLIIFGLKKYPFITLKSLVSALDTNVKCKYGKTTFEKVKEKLLSFIFEIPNYKDFINDFVKTHLKKIKPWYLKQQTKNDVIVSASYDLWINEFAKELNIKYVVATKVNDKGKIIGRNCKGKEKVFRIKKLFPNKRFIKSFSDSSSDIPILELSSKSYVVENNNIFRYKRGYKFKNNR